MDDEEAWCTLSTEMAGGEGEMVTATHGRGNVGARKLREAQCGLVEWRGGCGREESEKE